MSDQLDKQLELARRDLLELSTANRLLDTKRDQERGVAVEIKDELSHHVFQVLVDNEAAMDFEQGVVEDVDGDAEAASAETGSEKKPTRRRRTTKTTTKSVEDPVDPKTDKQLHTVLETEELDRRLVGLVTDANALFQEQGTNVLYLAMGFLRWYEADDPGKSHDAPLILIPVELQRDKAGKRYSLKWTGLEIETNLTLQIRMKIDFDIDLPTVPDVEELSVHDYMRQVKEAVSRQPSFEVLEDDMVLWFFSFTKLLMYRDLDPASWPKDKPLKERPLIRQLLDTGFPPVEPLCGDNDLIDPIFDPVQTAHVIDCDSSQSLVIEEACRGRSMVIQGPPGTGKSQTITNLIASAVTAGKTILFVAEKMAALEVVKRRLDNIGIGDMCLELHSNKAKKRDVLAELDRTLKLGAPQLPANLSETVKRLKQRRDELNRHVECMHTPQQPGGKTPYQILTELIDLRASDAALPDFQLEEAVTWTGDDYNRKQEAVNDLSRVMNDLGDVNQHPWRGCELSEITPLDLERLVAAVPRALPVADELITAARSLSQKLGDDPALTLSDISGQLTTTDALLSAPQLDATAAAGTTWVDHRKAVKELADGARAILRAKKELAGKVSDAAWDTDVAQARQDYATYGKSFFRIFYGAYRSARNVLNSVLTGPAPDTFEGRLDILNLLYGHQKAMKDAVDNTSLGEKAFGRFWLGNKTDWQLVADWDRWDQETTDAGASPRFRSLLTLLDDKAGLQAVAADVKQKLASFADSFCGICDTLKLNIPRAFGSAASSPGLTSAATSETVANTVSPASGSSGVAGGDSAVADNISRLIPAKDVPLSEIRDRMSAWKDNPEGLQHWQMYSQSRKVIDAIGGGVLSKAIDDGKISAATLPSTFRFAYYEAVLKKVLKDNPELAAFESSKFEQHIDEFQTLDVDRLQLARAEVAAAHWTGIGRKRGGNMGEAVALLRHEMQKKRRHLPLRQLLNKAGTAVQAIKPVFMMSPLSVSQYLEPGALDFDILLIDEASQVRPVEALGASARCRQMICVGDDKQMPPTQFFGVTVGDIDLDDGESPAMQAGDVESVLGLCIARNMPQRMLRWHYRSKHESLIAVSNREFYENRLYVIPSAYRTGELGVKWHPIEGGVFEKGRNEVEARVVAEHIMQHARERPHWTLGVAAFSVSQRDTIIKELEKLRREDPSCESFFDPNAPDPFFVKNLENVQGDERDVIFVSVGYGPGEDGKVSLNFGPVSASGGERRLNVLMTRAKRRCEMFSSMRAEDIDVNRVSGRGPVVFREYLRFAQNGAIVEGAEAGLSGDRLVEVLRKQLMAKGYEVQTHVGIAGVFVDLAVVDPENPDRYLLGIDIDGESYKASRSARDRDRTRHAVLGSQGWKMHRIWSLEWFKRPKEKLNELVAAVEEARRGKKSDKPASSGAKEFQVTRTPGGPDPLSTAVADALPVPDRPVTAPPDSNSASSGSSGATDSDDSGGGSLVGDIAGSLLKAGLAAATAKKGKGLEAAIKSLGSEKTK
ncbi:MAG: DUF4011 domain-containing protein [Planctomycetaceae bacterium]|nr:DUF4011 domain-containing protein [Planctomycetaceae bacterium]